MKSAHVTLAGCWFTHPTDNLLTMLMQSQHDACYYIFFCNFLLQARLVGSCASRSIFVQIRSALLTLEGNVCHDACGTSLIGRSFYYLKVCWQHSCSVCDNKKPEVELEKQKFQLILSLTSFKDVRRLLLAVNHEIEPQNCPLECLKRKTG